MVWGRRGRQRFFASIFFLVYLLPLYATKALAATGSGGYLAGYENVDPKPATISWWSTIAYLVSLFVVFCFVVALAYGASRLLGGYFAKSVAAGSGGRIISHLPLGPNRSVAIVELSGYVFVVGVTEHSITLLREITDEKELERLHTSALGRTDAAFPEALTSQLGSLRSLANRIPSMFKDETDRR